MAVVLYPKASQYSDLETVYAQYDSGCRAEPDGEHKTIELTNGVWLSFEFILGRKPV